MRHHHGDVRGALAGYAADEYLLGHRRRAHHVIRVAVRRHRLGAPGGRHFLRRVKRFLARHGYGR